MRTSRSSASHFGTGKFRYLIAQLLFSSAALAAPSKPGDFSVVLDPGHGGTDLGTVFESGPTRLAEKDLTLALAQEAARVLSQHGVSVTLTRTRDQLMDLGSRTALANKLHAQVFVSIHLNSQQGALGTSSGASLDGASVSHQQQPGSASGIETYILNNTSDASSHRLARLENSVLGGNDTSKENLDVALILKDLTLDHNLADSKRLACAIQERLISHTSPALDRGVKQALFHVLLGADMPSVLVEAGFLSHARDRAMLMQPASRSQLARAIAEGVLQYRNTSAGTRTGTSVAKHGSGSPCKVR